MKFGQAHTAETRAKMSDARRGRPHGPMSQETRAKISAWHTGRPSELKGRKHSEAHRAASSSARKGVPKSLEFRARVAQTMRGKIFGPCSAETKAKISAAKVGRCPKITPEHRQKMVDGIRLASASGLLTVPPSRSYTGLAQALHVHLSSTGLTLEPEVKFGRFTVDLYDREHHIAYEADGSYWHQKHEQRHPGYSTRRDEYLVEMFGLKVVHFLDKEITALTGWPRKRRAVA